MMFNTQFDKRAPVFQEPGSRVKVVYSPKYTDNGVLDLFPSGQENLYEYIQSHAQSVDIHFLLNRFVNGETDVLQRMQGFYGDITDMPKTYAEVLNSVIAGEEAFARLPVEIKNKFHNSFAVWMSSFDSPDFAEKMGFAPKDAGLSPQQVQDLAGSAAAADASVSVAAAEAKPAGAASSHSAV